MVDNTVIKSSYNENWQLFRYDFILSRYPKDFWDGKKVLELAPFNGYFSAQLRELGAETKCVEGREENVAKIRENYQLDVECYDLDTPEWPWGRYDVIINFGLLYHLETYHRPHLLNCIRNSSLLLFETRVVDAPGAALFFRREDGPDQALPEVNFAATPTTDYVEHIFRESGKSFEKVLDQKLSPTGTEKQNYLWPDKFSDNWRESSFSRKEKRRFWIVQ